MWPAQKKPWREDGANGRRGRSRVQSRAVKARDWTRGAVTVRRLVTEAKRVRGRTRWSRGAFCLDVKVG